MLAFHSSLVQCLDVSTDWGQFGIPISFIPPGWLVNQRAHRFGQVVVRRRESDKHPLMAPLLPPLVPGGGVELVTLVGATAEGDCSRNMVPSFDPGIEVVTKQSHGRLHADEDFAEVLEDRQPQHCVGVKLGKTKTDRKSVV